MIEPGYRIVASGNLEGGDPVREPLDARIVFGTPMSITIDLSGVRFARPSGLAFLYVLIYTLSELGHR